MIHLEGGSLGESSKLMFKVRCEMNSTGLNTPFPLYSYAVGSGSSPSPVRLPMAVGSLSWSQPGLD